MLARRAVIHVVERVGPVVVNIRIGRAGHGHGVHGVAGLLESCVV